MVDARDDRAKRNIATALCNQLITTACGIVTLRVLLASFGSEAYGICASITQFLSYIMLLESGIGGVARAKLYAPLARRDMCEVSAVYNAAMMAPRASARVFWGFSVLMEKISLFILLTGKTTGQAHTAIYCNKKTALSRLEGAARLRPIVLFKDWMVTNSPQRLPEDYNKREEKKQPSFLRKKAALSLTN